MTIRRKKRRSKVKRKRPTYRELLSLSKAKLVKMLLSPQEAKFIGISRREYEHRYKNSRR